MDISAENLMVVRAGCGVQNLCEVARVMADCLHGSVVTMHVHLWGKSVLPCAQLIGEGSCACDSVVFRGVDALAY